jgi:hypothetical protein
LELNFVPARTNRQAAARLRRKGIAGETLSFFVGLKTGAGRWFFDIYIQGSKYNFKS